MIWNILQLIFCTMLFAVPMALYKSNRPFMARFYNAMVYREKARRLYVQILLILLLLFHYVYACGHVGEFGILLSTAVCAAIYSFRRTDRWLRHLPGRASSFVALATAVLVIGFVPHRCNIQHCWPKAIMIIITQGCRRMRTAATQIYPRNNNHSKTD